MKIQVETKAATLRRYRCKSRRKQAHLTKVKVALLMDQDDGGKTPAPRERQEAEGD